MREVHVPGNFERLDQGSRARASQLEAFKKVQQSLVGEGLVVVPSETPNGLRIPRVVLPAVAVLGLIGAACGPARGGETQVQPPPAATAEMASPTAQSDLATAVPTEAQPTVAPTEAPRATAGPTVEIIPAPQISDQLDSLVSTVKALPQPLRPNRTEEQFVMDKRNIEVPAQEAKDELSKGDTENARKRLAELKAAVKGLGDPLKGNFIPKEIRDKYDPQGLVLKPTDRVDPAIMDWYLAVVKMELALVAGGKG